MGVGVKVPGGWVGTRSIGVKMGPVYAGTRHGGISGLITTLITLPIWALVAVINLFTLAVWLLAAALWVVIWTVKAVCLPFIWAGKALWWLLAAPFRAATKQRRRRTMWAAPHPATRIG